jgi:dihydrolipoamide dehydrogenase
MAKYDLLVIGAGPAGYVAAIRASQLGLKAAVVEKEYLGGVCLNVGCIPSKSLLKNAELAYTLNNKARDFGITFDNLQLDYGSAVKRSRRVSKRLTKGVELLLKNNQIDLFMGRAELVAPDRLKVHTEDGELELDAKNIVLATGASPFIIPGIQVDGKQILTYTEAILQEHLPESVLIVGAGAIGMEFATIWNSYGVEVTLVEMLDRVLPNEDSEVSEEVSKAFKKRRIKILLNSKVTGVKQINSQVSVSIDTPEGEELLSTEQVLLATSFLPNSQGLGLEKIGVEVDQKGFILIDQQMATNIPGIWAIGDVTGKLMLAHVGMAMGVTCAEAIAGKNPPELNYQNMPRATYCHPQVASIGLTEEMARQSGYTIAAGKVNFISNGKALGLNDYAGWVKIIMDQKTNHILGAHLVGPEVTELLPELSLAQAHQLSPADIGHIVHAHPTLSEILHEAAKAVSGEAIHS